MSLTAAEGPISRADTLLAASLAACARWQSMVGAVAAPAALARIHFGALPPPDARRQEYSLAELAALRPFAIVFADEDTTLTLRHKSTGTRRRFHDEGLVKFYIERDVPAELALDPAELDRRFKNDAGVLMQELCALAGLAGYLAINEITGRGPLRSDKDEVTGKGDYQHFYFDVQWGRT